MATTRRIEAEPVRGGVSIGAVLTGVVVAFGAIFLLSALLGGILTATGVDASDIQPGDTALGVGIAFVVIQFLAFLWGGYTAGRMARGAGLLNGLLVPVGALVLAALVWVATASLGAVANLNLPFTASRLPVEESYLVEWGEVIGLVALAALVLGGLAGGMLGARWHSQLEAHARETRAAREGMRTPVAERTITLDERSERPPEREPTVSSAATRGTPPPPPERNPRRDS